jgi:hypothetical protein
MDAYMNPVGSIALGAIAFKGDVPNFTNSSCTFKYIANWKNNNVYDRKIFPAMAEWAITPYMMENYTLEKLIEHVEILITTNALNLSFFKTLRYCTGSDQINALAQKNPLDSWIHRGCFDLDAFLDENGLNDVYQQPKMKKLTIQLLKLETNKRRNSETDSVEAKKIKLE